MAGRPKKKRSIEITERILEDPSTKETIRASEIEVSEHGLDLIETWFSQILQMAGILSPARIQLVKFMLENMIPGENILVMTQREIARKSGVSYPTVAQTIQVLKGLGLVETKTGAVKFVLDQHIFTNDGMYILLKFQSKKPKSNKGGDEKQKNSKK